MKTATPKKRTATVEDKIFARYKAICETHGIEHCSEMDVWLTIDSVSRDKGLPKYSHARLLESSDFDFMHDIGGMIRHMDRSTCKLSKTFLPRCAR